MRRRNYLAGTVFGSVTSTSVLLTGCLDDLNAGGPDSGDEDGSNAAEAGGSSGDDTDATEASEDDTDSVNDGGEETSTQDRNESRQRDDDRPEQADGDGRREDEESEQPGSDENEHSGTDESEQASEDDETGSEANGVVEFEVIDMTPSMESGSAFTYIVLAYADRDGSASIPGDATLLDETGTAFDSTRYEATPDGGNFELTYRAPTVDEETDVRLVIETDHGAVNLGTVRVFPSESAETNDSSGSTENASADDE